MRVNLTQEALILARSAMDSVIRGDSVSIGCALNIIAELGQLEIDRSFLNDLFEGEKVGVEHKIKALQTLFALGENPSAFEEFSKKTEKGIAWVAFMLLAYSGSLVHWNLLKEIFTGTEFPTAFQSDLKECFLVYSLRHEGNLEIESLELVDPNQELEALLIDKSPEYSQIYDQLHAVIDDSEDVELQVRALNLLYRLGWKVSNIRTFISDAYSTHLQQKAAAILVVEGDNQTWSRFHKDLSGYHGPVEAALLDIIMAIDMKAERNSSRKGVQSRRRIEYPPVPSVQS